MGKVISFEPRVGKVQTGQTSGGFAVIIPKKKTKKQKQKQKQKQKLETTIN